MRDALGALELLVTVDLFRNETGQLADYVLPATSFLERSDLPLGAQGFATEPFLQYTPAVVKPEGEQREEWWIYIELARAIGTPLFAPGVAAALSGWERLRGRGRAFRPEMLFAGMVAGSRQTSLAELRRHPHGMRLRREAPGAFVPGRLLTKGRRIDLAPLDVVQAARALDSRFEAELRDKDAFRLITKRERRTHNSWMHNSPSMVRGRGGEQYAYMNPEDAARLGLVDGSRVRIRGNGRAVELPLRVSDEVGPRVVAVPHGWGHSGATGLKVASETVGVNVNVLAKDGPGAVERISGMTKLTGISVEVELAAHVGVDPQPTIRD